MEKPVALILPLPPKSAFCIQFTVRIPKFSALVAVCSLQVMEILPELAEAGTTTVNWVLVAWVIFAGVPLNFTTFAEIEDEKLVPVIITSVPALPFIGVILAIVGGWV